MGFGFAQRDQAFTDGAGKRQVCPSIAMKVPNLPAADLELDPAEAMRRRGHAGPGFHFVSDGVGSASHGELDARR